MKKIILLLFVVGVGLAQSPNRDIPERPAVIVGRIIAPDGKPLANIGVEALRLDYHGGGLFLKNPITGGALLSDDRGEFRISVPPGDYYVRTLLSIPSSGIFPGENPLFVSQFANTYYPGTLDFNRAKLIHIRAGNIVEGIHIVHLGGKLHQVSGTFTGASNQGHLWCVFYPRGGPAGHYGPASLPVTQIGEGRFQVNLGPGSWDVYVARTTGDRPINSPAASITHFGKFSVDVNDADVAGLVLDFKPTTSVSGKILAPSGLKLKGEITLEGLFGIPERLFTAQAMTRSINPTGVFEITNAPVGEFDLRLRNLPPGVYVSDILTGNTSILNRPLKVTGTPLKDIRIVLKDDGGAVSGIVLTEDGKPVLNKTVVAVPRADLRWNTMAYAHATTDNLGRFTMKDVAPGSYELFSWEYFPEGRGRDDVVVAPELLERYKDDGMSVTVDSSKLIENIELRLLPWK